MEEGPEPQELLEQLERHEHAVKGEEEHGLSKFNTRSAIIASILAVLAALGSLLSGDAANEAILKQSEASDQWSLFQAKSTKGHIFEANKEILSALAAMASPEKQAALAILAKASESKVEAYAGEKEKIQREAEKLQAISADSLGDHQKYSVAVALFQIGIVLSSVSILASSKGLQIASLFTGLAGVLYCAIAILT